MASVRRLAVGLGLAFGLAACGSSGGGGSTGSSNYQGKTLNFGAVFSLTGAGGVYGPQQQNGVQLAEEVINKNGGGNGAKIAFDTKDDALETTKTAQVTQTM